jgi:NitT/TauT family transport system ATP-binding protein
MAGLLKPGAAGSLSVSFMFQEPRLLPWKTALENVILPLKKLMGKAEAADRARRFLSLVGLSDRAGAYPRELSGGQCQRISMARAFAYPSDLILMDEPFQSLDIPLRKQLMELSLSLLAGSPRRMAAVTHEPREAVFLGRRIIVLGEPPRGIVFDERLNLSPEDRRYGSEAWIRMEARLLSVLTGAQSRETIGGS